MALQNQMLNTILPLILRNEASDMAPDAKEAAE